MGVESRHLEPGRVQPSACGQAGKGLEAPRSQRVSDLDLEFILGFTGAEPGETQGNGSPRLGAELG